MLLSNDDVARLLVELEADHTAWHARDHGRWSLAGAQAKLALAWDATHGSWCIPTGAAPTTHIVKPAIVALDHHDLNEHLCLGAARQLGHATATSEITRFGRQQALVITRYDRHQAADAQLVRVHQEDGCQALGVHPDRKYQSEGGPSLEDLISLLRTVVQPDPQPDIERLVHAAVFNWLVLGTDAHAKNYSLLLSGPQVRLAPLYDVASAAPYDLVPSKVRLAQKIGGEYRPHAITARHWERLARSAGMASDELVDYVDRTAQAVPDAFADAARASSRSRVVRRHAAAIVDAIAAWSATALATLRDGPDY